MFRQDSIDAASPNLRRAGGAAFGVLQSAMAEVLAFQIPAPPLLPSLALAWSSLHGFATLLIERQLDGCAAEGEVKDQEADLGKPILRLMAGALLPGPVGRGGNS